MNSKRWLLNYFYLFVFHTEARRPVFVNPHASDEASVLNAGSYSLHSTFNITDEIRKENFPSTIPLTLQ